MAELFHWPLRVYIEDTDAGGIVYYVNYLKFIERARTEFMRSLGFDKRFIFATDSMFVVHSLTSDFLQPARLDDELVVSTQLLKVGRATLLMAQNVYRVHGSSDEEELLCRVEVKLACVDKQNIKPRRISAALLDKLKISLNVERIG